MTFVPRPYQQEAHDAAIAEIKTTVSPCLIDAAPAAGKSWIIKMLAETIHGMSGKKILCLAPSAELVTQNRDKYLASGHKASMFSASAGAKDLWHPVVFGSPVTVKNRISRFKSNYGAVIIDEAHGITPTIKSIVEAMREGNPNLRVIGLSGTPFRLGTGYIFREWPDGTINGEDTCRDPYFHKCVKVVSADEMLEQGYITPMDIGDINATAYSTDGLVEKRGKFTDASLNETFVGQGRLTASIVANVVQVAQNMYGGCMIFAATVQHAMEIMESLPPRNSGFVTGDDAIAIDGMVKGRKSVIKAYREQRFKYLVSVGTLTTGFDVEHTSLIATLRKTESAALLQQILGRAWRLDPLKLRALWLDFAENCEHHFPDGNIYRPTIKASLAPGEGGLIQATCPTCSYENEFTAHRDYLEYEKDESGYCLDLEGQQVMSDHGPVPGHHGRRCLAQFKTGPLGTYERCNYRWTFKPCPECDAENDIAARYCKSCKAEIIDPNEKLKMEFTKLKKTPTDIQIDKVLNMTARDSISQKGNKTLTVTFETPWRSFTIWLMPESRHTQGQAKYAAYQWATQDGQTPRTVTYRKNADSGLFEVLAYNQEEQHEPA